MMTLIPIYDIIGIIGVILVLVNYLQVVRGKLDPTKLGYPTLSILACILLSISLAANFNLSAFVIQLFYFIISVYAIVRFFWRKKK